MEKAEAHPCFAPVPRDEAVRPPRAQSLFPTNTLGPYPGPSPKSKHVTCDSCNPVVWSMLSRYRVSFLFQRARGLTADANGRLRCYRVGVSEDKSVSKQQRVRCWGLVMLAPRTSNHINLRQMHAFFLLFSSSATSHLSSASFFPSIDCDMYASRRKIRQSRR